jgi:hypothetical protein
MKIDLKDFETIYTSDGDYDGPEGTMLKGEQFRVYNYEFELTKCLFAAMIIGEDEPMLFRHNDGTIVSD